MALTQAVMLDSRRGTLMSSITSVGAGALLRQSSFVFFLSSRSLSRFSSLIGIVAMGWQIYDLTGSAFALGAIGLVGFLPTALLVFVAGHTADRYERKRILQACQLAEARIGVECRSLDMGTRIVPEDAGAQHLV